MEYICEILLAALTFICLTIGCYQDVKTRYTSNKLWAIQGIGSAILLIACGVISPYSFLEIFGIVLNVLFALFFGFLFLYLGAWGGGDSKAMMVLGISSPFVFSFIPMDIPLQFSLVPLFLILFNMLPAMLLILVITLGYNLISIGAKGVGLPQGSFVQKLIILITAFPIKPERLTGDSFLDPVEVFENDDWHADAPVFGQFDEEDEVLERRERERRNEVRNQALAMKKAYVWVRPQIPGLLLFWIAYVIWLFYGSIGLPFLAVLL